MKKPNLKLFFKKRTQRLSVFGVSVTFDWRFIIGLATLVMLFWIAYAGWLYVNIADGSLFQVVEEQDSRADIDQKRKEIENAVQKIERRSFDEPVTN